MERVTVLDTAVASKNQGDEIIMDAVSRNLSTMFPDAFFSSVATHEWMFGRSHELIRGATHTFAGGSNLIGSRLWLPGRLANWKVGPHDAPFVRDVTLLGVGWHSYEKPPGLYTRWLLKSLLNHRLKHSVRDEYTKRMLESIGFDNVINTGCPTLWDLTPEHCAELPLRKADRVVCTLNINRPDRDLDRELLVTLKRHYREVLLWVQTHADHAYCESLGESVRFAPANLRGLDGLLDGDEPIDYVGNRLHAGIRALQKRRRTIILSIDNRAAEMGGDYALPTVGRDSFGELSEMIESELETRIRIPQDRIEEWKSQFRP